MSFYSYEEGRIRQEGDVWIAPTATIIGDVLLKSRSSVWWGAVLRADFDAIEVGEASNIQDNCVVHTDEDYPTTIGDCVTVGHGAVLHGCTIQDNCLVGINSVVMNGAVVEENCLIGSNALITEGKHIPAGSLVLGSPAKVARELTQSEIAELTDFSDRYLRLVERYLAGLHSL